MRFYETLDNMLRKKSAQIYGEIDMWCVFKFLLTLTGEVKIRNNGEVKIRNKFEMTVYCCGSAAKSATLDFQLFFACFITHLHIPLDFVQICCCEQSAAFLFRDPCSI